MTTYLARRLLQTVFVILGVTLLTFVALHLAGDPTYLYVSERATAEEVAAARAKLGFDKPLPEQYLAYMSGLIRFDLGNSLRSRAPAFGLVMERMPATIELTLFALMIAVILAIPIGIPSATEISVAASSSAMVAIASFQTPRRPSDTIRTATARSRRSRSSTLSWCRTSSGRRRPATPTSCCRRRRPTSATTSRASATTPAPPSWRGSRSGA